MPGHFYPPPPTFIGGTQPYAPRLGISQSGPVPQAPPLRGPIALATFGLLLAAWQPPFVKAQGSAQIAPLLPVAAVASNAPPPNGIWLRTVIEQWQPKWSSPQQVDVAPTLPRVDTAPAPSQALSRVFATWQVDPYIQIGLTSVAPFATQATSDAPPVTSGVNLQTILQAWVPPPPSAQGWSRIAPILPRVDAPPTRTFVNQSTLLASWVPPWIGAQGYSDIAPLIPVAAAPDQPPIPGTVTLSLVLRTWQPPFFAAQGYGEIAPLIPAQAAADQPPVPGSVTFSVVLRSWQLAPVAAQGAGDIAPCLPVVNAPPTPSGVTPALILQQWQAPVWMQPRLQFVQQQAQADAPPIRSGVAFRIALEQWQSNWTTQKRSSVAAILAPPPAAPDAPPRANYAKLFSLISRWEPPVWWPLPTLVPSVWPPALTDVRITYTADFDVLRFDADSDDVFFVAGDDPTRFDS